MQETNFLVSTLESFASDQGISNRQVDKPLFKAAAAALAVMSEDNIYRAEYEQFVDAMSYADDDKKIGFDEALTHFEVLAGRILS